MVPKKYFAATEVVVNSQDHDPITGSVASEQLMSRYMATQVDIIQSPELAARVVDRLELESRPASRKRYRESLDNHKQDLDEGDLKAWLIRSIQNYVAVSLKDKSSVLKISATGEEPLYLAEIANAYAEAYVQTNLYLRTEPAKNYALWYDDQVEELRGKLDNAQNELSAYQRDHGIADIDERLDVETRTLHQLSLRMVDALGENVASHSELAQMKRVGAPTPSVAENSLIRDLKSQLAAAEARASELSVVYTNKHPAYRQVKNEVDSLKRQLSQEMETVSDNVRSIAQISAGRLEGDKAAVTTQKSKMLDALRHKDKIALLKQDVEYARDAYRSAVQDASKNELESRRAQTDVMILSRATIPANPSSPNLRLNIVISVALGMLLGVGSALLLELIDRRVRGVRDLEDMLDLPVLSYISTKRGLTSGPAITR